MGKIGRNDPCPCGSGRKFKKCCLQNPGSGAAPQPAQPSINNEVEKIQLAAEEKKSLVRTLGVFVLFSSSAGDAWLLEVTEMDAVQVAAHGERVAVPIEENQETIEINWTHKFSIKDKKFVLTAYDDKTVTSCDDYPTHAISAAVKKIRAKVPPELLETLHIKE